VRWAITPKSNAKEQRPGLPGCDGGEAEGMRGPQGAEVLQAPLTGRDPWPWPTQRPRLDDLLRAARPTCCRSNEQGALTTGTAHMHRLGSSSEVVSVSVFFC